MPLVRMVALTVLFAVGGLSQGEEMPAEVDLRPEFSQRGLECRSQGSRNTCSLFAITAVANFEAYREAPGDNPRFSEEYLNWAADKATGRWRDGAMFYEAISGLQQWGICLDDQFAYRAPGDRIAPSPLIVEEASGQAARWRAHWIKRWDVREGLNAEQLAATKRALAAGHPVACGLRWPNGRPGAELLEVPPADQVHDGHSIVLVGYVDDPALPGGGKFLLRNSSGRRWGDRGYGSLSFAYAQAYANDAVWLEALAAGAQRPVERWEAETLEVAASQQCTPQPQRMSRFGSRMWSDRRQLECRSEQGGHVVLRFHVAAEGTYRLAVQATTAPHYGAVSFAVDDKPIPGTHDLYSGRVSPTGYLDLGAHLFSEGPHELRIESIGKNGFSSGYDFGIDTVDLLPPLGE